MPVDVASVLSLEWVGACASWPRWNNRSCHEMEKRSREAVESGGEDGGQKETMPAQRAGRLPPPL